MMGRSHATIGALCGLGIGVASSGTGRPEMIVVSTLVGAGAGLLPDLDEENSTVAKAGGFATEIVSHITAKVAGGHRQATHSFMGISVLVGAIAVAGLLSGDVTAVVGGLLAGLAVRVAARVIHLGRLKRFAAEVVVGAAVGWLLVGVPIWLVLAIVAAGMISHTIADDFTDSGTPLLWPSRRRFTLHLFHTGSPAETWVRFGLYGGLVAAAYFAISPHAVVLGAQVSHSFGPVAAIGRSHVAEVLRHGGR